MSALAPEKRELPRDFLESLNKGIIVLSTQDGTQTLEIDVPLWVNSWLAQAEENTLQLDSFIIKKALIEYIRHLPQAGLDTLLVTNQNVANFLYIVRRKYVTQEAEGKTGEMSKILVLGERSKHNPHYVIQELTDVMGSHPLANRILELLMETREGSQLVNNAIKQVASEHQTA